MFEPVKRTETDEVIVFGAGATALGLIVPAFLSARARISVLSRRPFAQATPAYQLADIVGNRRSITGFKQVYWCNRNAVLGPSQIWITAMGRAALDNELSTLDALARVLHPKQIIFSENLPMGEYPDLSTETRAAVPAICVATNFNVAVRHLDAKGQISGVTLQRRFDPLICHAYAGVAPSVELLYNGPFCHSTTPYNLQEKLKVCLQLNCMDGAFFLAKARGHTTLQDAAKDGWLRSKIAWSITDAVARLRAEFPDVHGLAKMADTMAADLRAMLFLSPGSDTVARNCRNPAAKLGRNDRFMRPYLDALSLGVGVETAALILAAVLKDVAAKPSDRNVACIEALGLTPAQTIPLRDKMRELQ